MRKIEPLILNHTSRNRGSHFDLIVGSQERSSPLVLNRRFDLDLRSTSQKSNLIRRPSYWVRQVDSLYHKGLSLVLVTLLFFSPFFPVVTFAGEDFNFDVIDKENTDLDDQSEHKESAPSFEGYEDAKETNGDNQSDLIYAIEDEYTEQQLDSLTGGNEYDEGETVENLALPDDLNDDEEFNGHEEDDVKEKEGNAEENDNDEVTTDDGDDKEIKKIISDDEKKDVASPRIDEFSNEESKLLDDESTETKNIKDKFNFSEEHCTLLSDRELYCVIPESAGERGEIVSFSDVQARVMPEGNREIILQRGEVMMNVSNNGDENNNPSYSKESQIVVWQHLVDDRWQIVAHDLVTGLVIDVTNNTYNNVNPHIYMNTVVWQGWADESWDIFSATINRDTDSGELEIKRITADKYPNTNPEVFGSVVMWQSYINNIWQVFIHDLGHGLTTQVSEGMENSRNARMAILWENENQEKTDVFQYSTATKKTSRIIGGKSIPDNNHSDSVPEHPTRENQSILPLQTGRSLTEESEGDDKELE